MPSEKVSQILRVRSDLTAQQISALSESGAWVRVYELDRAEKATNPAAAEICFTGFSASERAELEKEAGRKGLTVKTTVTKSLRLLCAGPSAGPFKLEKARIQGVRVISAEQFRHL